MTFRKSSKITSALIKKGFSQMMGDHCYYIFMQEERKTRIRTKLSHGNKEVSDKLIGKMADQLHISKKEFERLIDCSLNYEELTAIYLKKDLL